MKIQAQIDRMMETDGKVKAFASINLGGDFVVKGFSVMESDKGLFVRMPYRSYRDQEGNRQYSDMFFGLNAEAREELSDVVLSAYEQELQTVETEAQSMEEPDEPAFEQSM